MYVYVYVEYIKVKSIRGCHVVNYPTTFMYVCM